MPKDWGDDYRVHADTGARVVMEQAYERGLRLTIGMPRSELIAAAMLACPRYQGVMTPKKRKAFEQGATVWVDDCLGPAYLEACPDG